MSFFSNTEKVSTSSSLAIREGHRHPDISEDENEIDSSDDNESAVYDSEEEDPAME